MKGKHTLIGELEKKEIDTIMLSGLSVRIWP